MFVCINSYSDFSDAPLAVNCISYFIFPECSYAKLWNSFKDHLVSLSNLNYGGEGGDMWYNYKLILKFFPLPLFIREIKFYFIIFTPLFW